MHARRWGGSGIVSGVRKGDGRRNGHWYPVLEEDGGWSSYPFEPLKLKLPRAILTHL